MTGLGKYVLGVWQTRSALGFHSYGTMHQEGHVSRSTISYDPEETK